MPRWRWVVSQIMRRIWFRAALFSLSAVGLALLAAVMAPWVPYDLSAKIGAKAVDNILEILASSMLAVTTFSMSSMVAAYAGAASNITPRATRLLIEDSSAQNALSTFMGAFLFSIVGICALSTGAYGAKGRVILFVGSLVVIALIVFTMLRWIEHLSHFGRMQETIKRVERSAIRAASTLTQRPEPKARFELGVPLDSMSLDANQIGYVTHVDISAIERLVAADGCQVYVTAPPGTFVAPGRPVARIVGSPAADICYAISGAFTVEDARSFDHDPRFGLVVLSEIASRALSPAVNDPGSAIAVIGAGLRVLSTLLTTLPETSGEAGGQVRLPAMALEDILDDLFRPIARDGATLIEVDLQLQKALGALKALAPDAKDVIRACAADALRRSEAALASEPDRIAIRQAYESHWALEEPL